MAGAILRKISGWLSRAGGPSGRPAIQWTLPEELRAVDKSPPEMASSNSGAGLGRRPQHEQLCLRRIQRDAGQLAICFRPTLPILGQYEDRTFRPVSRGLLLPWRADALPRPRVDAEHLRQKEPLHSCFAGQLDRCHPDPTAAVAHREGDGEAGGIRSACRESHRG
ncbi:MAG TPA: hypothetical protein VER03_20195 [Bryobacteraceae bacterium]|nr:hypothetical protein [Bryobacteraceae bacterium]